MHPNIRKLAKKSMGYCSCLELRALLFCYTVCQWIELKVPRTGFEPPICGYKSKGFCQCAGLITYVKKSKLLCIICACNIDLGITLPSLVHFLNGKKHWKAEDESYLMKEAWRQNLEGKRLEILM
jgi:hypothetical protein